MTGKLGHVWVGLVSGVSGKLDRAWVLVHGCMDGGWLFHRNRLVNARSLALFGIGKNVKQNWLGVMGCWLNVNRTCLKETKNIKLTFLIY